MIGIGSAAPERIMSNSELATLVDTSDEWIKQRTGIERRHFCTPGKETQLSLSTEAAQRALDDAGVTGSDIDMVILATVTGEMICPANACRIAANIGATPAAAFDISAACSGFVYGLNIGDTMVRARRAERVLVIGCDTLSHVIDYNDRGVAILFGDGGGAVVLERDEERLDAGCIYQSMGADGNDWEKLYMPQHQRDVPAGDEDYPSELGNLRMRGRDVYRFAVTKFGEAIRDALAATDMKADDVAQFICHQSNARIIESAIEKYNLDPTRVRVNIDEYGNTSAGSIGLVLDELAKEGNVNENDVLVFVAFGGGLTWASSVWRV